MNEIRVASWNELNDELYRGSWNAGVGRFRVTAAYRGMDRAGYNLTTSLCRLGESSVDLEDALLRALKRYARREAVAADSTWNWLALAQHHGIPTRLLDWTYSPYVAAHFATESLRHFDDDAVIWVVDFAKTNALLPRRLQEIIAEEDSYVFTAEMLCRAAATLEDFERLSDDPFVIFFEPPSLDERIVNQYALFSLPSNPSMRLDEWLAEHPDTWRRIIVPAELKWEVRDKLDQANITERVLYPGLDGLGRWLRRYYTPRSDRHPDHAEGAPTSPGS